MKLRFFLPAFIWSGFMVLVFLTPFRLTRNLYFDLIPSRAIAHAFLFAVFVYTLTAALKRQWKYKKLKSNAEFISLLISAAWLMLASALESGINASGISGWNLLFGLCGCLLGIGVFKLVYGKRD